MSRRKQANPKPLKVDEERVGQVSGEKGDNSAEVPMKEDTCTSAPVNGLYNEDYEDDFRPLVIDTSADPVPGTEHVQNGGSDHEDSSSKHSINLGDKEIEENADRVSMVKRLEHSGESTPISYSGNAQSPCSSVPPMSPGSAPNSPSSHKPVPGRRAKKPGVPNTPPSVQNSDKKFDCPLCSKTLGSSHELTKHIRSHNSIVTGTASNNMCTICGKVLSSQSSLDRHMLVHSGERPFKCRVCNMAFTTNGNMHRHMRIHGKEGELASSDIRSARKSRVNKPLAPRRELNVPSMVGFQPIQFPGMGLDEQFLENSLLLSKPIMDGHRSKRGLENEEEGNRETKRRISYNSDPQIDSPSSSQSGDDLVEKMDNGIKDMQQDMNIDTDPLHCPVCGKSFLCKYGLESHMETHPSYVLRCQVCSLSFQTQLGLQKHKLFFHSNNNTDKHLSTSPVPNGNGEEETPVGFHDLDFMEFSNSKFSLAAKAFCERNPRLASSTFHNFSCKDCTKTFPCNGALKLHECSHIPEKMATCPICQCDFENAQKLHVHMIKHLSDKALAECHEKTDLSNSKGHESLLKHSFLAYFDLKSTEDLSDQGEAICNVSDIEKKQNDDYFAKLGQVYSAKLALQKKARMAMKKEGNCRNNVDSHLAALSEGDQALSPSTGRVHIPSVIGNLGSSGSPVISASRTCYPSPVTSGSPLAGQPVSTPPSHFRMLPANGMNMMHAVSLGVHTDSPSPTAVSPLTDDDSGSGAGDLLTHDKSASKGMFVCKYCDKSFTNYRALKGHTRTHLGLSPYKCNLCSYSSADKSTLIRHLRTHNGERPFQCLVCDFAFTTKANCERHVRKKHGKVCKEDIEKSIGYNKFVSADSAKKLDSTNFHSPDTICKYCGVDFKFFRALKHHLRSHSSCRQKPFLCQKCSIGFSTKANCVRHIQKQHLDVPQNLIERFIHVNEPAGYLGLMDKDGDQLSDASMENSFGSVCSSPSLSMMRFSSTPTQNGVGLLGSSPSPLPAHSTPVRTLPKTSPSVLPMSVKSEPAALGDDQPLDFSMKPEKTLPPQPSPKPQLQPKTEPACQDSDEVPMDLTVKRNTDTEPSRPSVSKPVPSPVLSTPIQCQYCPRGFSTRLALERHQRQQHFIPQAPSSLLNKSAPSISIPMQNSQPASAGSGSDCELASIHKMMNVTDPHQFKAFFQVPDNLDNSPIKFSRRNIDRKHLLHDADNRKPSETKLSPSGSVDENFNKKSYAAEELLCSGETTPTGPAQFSFNDDEEHDDSLENDLSEHIKDEISEGISMDSFNDSQKGDAEANQQKKKRNSYADSPHKLHCPYCPRTFPWVSSLTRHLLTHTGQKPFKCPRCPVTFSTKSNRERHLIRKHGVNMLDPASRQTMDRPFKCHLCIFSSFSTKSNLLKHYHDRHPGCNVPDAILRGEHCVEGNDLDMIDYEEGQGMEGYNELMSEPEFEENYKQNEEEFAKVELIMHDEPEKKQTPISSRPLNPERDNYNVDKITECWKCSAKFLSRKLLVRHLKEHNIDFPFKCYLCDASFEMRKECLYHQERVHTEDWPHLREKNKVDDIDEFSDTMEELVAKNYKGGDLEGNEISNVLAGEEAAIDAATSDYIQRKVYCSLCPKRFWSLQDLRRHMRSHTGEKPFECDLCQKRFTLKHSMMRHRKKHFEMPDSMSASDDEDSIPSEDLVSKGGEKKNLVIESVLNRLRVHQEQQAAASQLKEKKNFNRDLFAKKKLGYLQGRKSPLSGVSAANSRDILQSLLGVEDSAIDEMLESVDSAAERLGVK